MDENLFQTFENFKQQAHHDLSSLFLLASIVYAEQDWVNFLGTSRPYPVPFKEAKTPEQCQIQQVHLISRHGERYPGESTIRDMHRIKEMIDDINVPKSSPYHQYLDSIKVPFRTSQSGELHDVGRDTLKRIGARGRVRYDSLIHHLNHNDIWVQTSNMPRCIESSYQFLSGLLDSEKKANEIQSKALVIENREEDSDINPYESCRKHQKTMEDINEKYQETEIYKDLHGSRVQKIVAEQLHVSRDRISAKFLRSLYNICTYRYTLLSQTSDIPVECQILTEAGLLYYSQVDDLADFYEFGYANSMNARMQCSLLAGIKNQMENMIDKRTSRDAKTFTVRFGHMETLMPLITAFGLFDDKELLTGRSINEDRKWKTASFASFSANLWLELLKCDRDGSWFVRVLVNEVPVIIPGCDHELCQIDRFYRIMGMDEKTCNFDSVCENKYSTFGFWNSQ